MFEDKNRDSGFRVEWHSPHGRPDEVLQRLLATAAESDESPVKDMFYRELCLSLAKQATQEFSQAPAASGLDAAAAVRAFLSLEESAGRQPRGQITTTGTGFRVQADVHACQYVSTCKRNLKALGEVPHCVRAVTLIKAIDAKVPQRPPMTYDLKPGLVDETGPTCHVQLRPAGEPSFRPEVANVLQH